MNTTYILHKLSNFALVCSPLSLQKGSGQSNEIWTTAVCLGYISGVKVNFILAALQFGHRKALVTDFIDHNQIFLRFWQKLL